MNQVDQSSIDWDLDEQVIYKDLLLLVLQKGPFHGWYVSPIEGYHRFIGSAISLLCGPINMDTGVVIPHTLTPDHFKNRGLGEKRDDISEEDFRQLFFDSVFGKTNQKNIVSPAMYYYDRIGLPAGEVAYHHRVCSRQIASGKQGSVRRCCWADTSSWMAQIIRDITIEQASFRADFSGTKNPTYPYQDANKVTGGLDSMNTEFPMCKNFTDESYWNYVLSPFEDKTYDEAIQALRFKTLEDKFHFGKSTDAYKEIENKGQPESIGFPFIGSYLSLAEDIGDQFGLLSQLTPDTVNGAILAPRIISRLYCEMKKISTTDALQAPERISLISFFLTFCNNNDHTLTFHKLHGAWSAYLKKQVGKTICDGDACIIGCTFYLVSIFNAAISVGTEGIWNSPWEAKKQRLEIVASSFQSTFSAIGTTKPGRNVGSVVRILGE